MSVCLTELEEYSTNDSVYTDYLHSHPKTVTAFRSMQNGSYWFERLLSLEHSWKQRISQQKKVVISYSNPPESAKNSPYYDVVYGGGGLATIHAAAMAKLHNLKPLVFDKFTVGITHRDWNISQVEFDRLVEIGLLTKEQADEVVVRRYKNGFVEFYSDNSEFKGDRIWMDGVLDMAVSANDLLLTCKDILIENGGSFSHSTTFSHVWVYDGKATIEIIQNGVVSYVQCAVFVDCMGSYSPVAQQLNPKGSFTHCCPTVGTISSGFVQGTQKDEVDPTIGEILLTLDDAQADGRQFIWEGFPSKDDEFVTYLFFYDEIDSETDKSLLNLFEIFFEKLPTYKKLGENFDYGRPAFGMIPSILHPTIRNSRIVATDSILCLGDSAALSSPLTYCGFGSFVRNFDRTTTLLSYAIKNKLTSVEYLSEINAFEPNVSIVGNFAKFLVGKKKFEANTVNSMMNMIVSILQELPQSVAKSLFTDTLQWEDYNKLMSSVPVKYPNSYSYLFKHHGFIGLLRWAKNFLGFTAYHFLNKKKNLFSKSQILQQTKGSKTFSQLVAYFHSHKGTSASL